MVVTNKQQVSEAKRNAEALFEQKTVAEIREIEVRTKKDIELKKQQLRQLVGDSYRDLIDSADKIVAIASNCGSILSNVETIQQSFSTLAHSFTTADSLLNEKRDSVSKHEELYAVGSRVKYIVDTPEIIWGCLDSHEHLEAARRFLRAQLVHQLLGSSVSADMLAKFPLLAHQWPLVEKFRKQMINAAHTDLHSDISLNSNAAADALAAVCALEALDCHGAMQLLLSSRKVSIVSQMSAAAAQGASHTPDAVTQLLAHVASTVQMTISQVGELFIASSKGMSDGQCKLQAAAREDEVNASELVFGGRGPASTGSSSAAAASQGPELEAWRKVVKALQDRLNALPSGPIERACMQWVRDVAEEVARHAPALLANCSSAQSLVTVEQALRSSITSWRHPSSKSRAVASKRQRMAAVQAQAGLVGQGPVEQEFNLDSWQSVCDWVLGAQLNVWQEVFHGPFVQRAKQLIQDSFAQVARAVEQPLSECFSEAGAAVPEPVGQVSCGRWPLVPVDMNGAAGVMHTAASTQLARTWSDKLSGSRTKAAGAASDKGFRQRVHSIRQCFDDELKAVLQAALLLMGIDPSTSYSSATFGMSSFHSAGGAHSRPEGSRASELEPYVQQNCCDLASGIAASLQEKLDQLGPPAEGGAGAPTAEQVLLVARVCSALASESRYLQVLLSSPDSWRHSMAAGPGPMARSTLRTASIRGPAASSKLQAVVDAFKATAASAYRLWATWSASSLASQLSQDTEVDDILVSNATPLSWQETVVSSSEPDNLLAEPLADMKFSLPACPSSSVMSFLMSACQEIRRAGDHAAGAEALQILEWELAGAAYQAYLALLQPITGALSGKLTEKGVLQLLMDVRFVRDVLGGGRPIGNRGSSRGGSATALDSGVASTVRVGAGVTDLQDPGVMAAVNERKRQAAALEQQLQELLDPIDWATYEPYLWSNVQKYYQRVAVLLGSLIQLQRVHPEAAGKTAMAMHEMNPLNVLPVVPRFQYLPISAPAALHPSSSKTRLGLGSTGRLAAGSSSSDLAGNYSFADLGTNNRAAASQAAGSQTPQDTAGVSAFSALQARFQAGSLGSLGSILGDKAAEMTAMAQQRFDNIADLLPTSALGSGLLSSFAKNVAKK